MKILDRRNERDAALGILDAVGDLGLEPEEAIPALIRAALIVAMVFKEDEARVVDEAFDLLNDGLEDEEG